jgi:isoprenylcysteine carboxyl methyltransferase (ICMT) family protein YpbQ
MATFARINHIEWFLGLVLFGVVLIQTIQTNWAAVIGLLCIFTGYAVLAYGLGKSIGSIIKGGK